MVLLTSRLTCWLLRVLNFATEESGRHLVRFVADNQIPLAIGRREIGKTIGETAISMAREIAERKERKLRDRDLAWLDEGSVEFEMYIEGLRGRRTTQPTTAR